MTECTEPTQRTASTSTSESFNSPTGSGSYDLTLASEIASINTQTKLLRTSEASKSKKMESLRNEMSRYELENLPNEPEEIARNLALPAMTFWIEKMNRKAYPCLYEIAKIVHSIPASQTSVERLFSSLDFILNKVRGRMMRNIIDKILLIRSNKKLFSFP